jgi:hypothetical protein
MHEVHEALTSVTTSTSSTSISDWAASCRINASDKRTIQILLWALKPLSSLRGSIPLEIPPEPTGHGLPLIKCEVYNRVYDQRSRSS